MFDFSSVLILSLLAVTFTVLALKARRAQHRAVRWLGTGLAGLLALAGFALLAGALYGYWVINHDRGNPVPDLQVAVTPDRVERGSWFEPYCTSCHSPAINEPLTGRDFLGGGSGGPPVGRFWAPNLTPVQLGEWSDGEIARAIREGIHRNGRALLIMPSQLLRHLSDEDVAAVIAWLRSLPPAGEPTPPNSLNALGALMAPFIDFVRAQPPVKQPVPHPNMGPNPEYGAYLYTLTCALCHGEDAMGLSNFSAPPLVHIPVAWNEAQFIDFMRSGQRPDGSSVNGRKMPWEDLSLILRDDDELRAIYAHLAEVQARQGLSSK